MSKNSSMNSSKSSIVSFEDAVFEIELRLDAYGLDKLSELLQSQSAVIAGSFPLQCLCGENWNTSDIDILVQHADAEPIRKYLESIAKFMDKTDERVKYHEKNVVLYDFTKFVKVSTYVLYLIPENELPVMRYNNADEYYNESISRKFIQIQVIELNDEYDAISNCIRSFDLNVCKVFYDGINIHSMVDTSYIESRSALYQSDDYFKGNHVKDSRAKARISKYERRGFDITLCGHGDEVKSVKAASKNE